VVKSTLPLVACCAPIARPTLSDDEAIELERLFKALADRNRVKILNLLVQAGEDAVCVCDFVEPLGLKQPTVSYHLKQLVDVGLLAREPRGTYAYYSLAPGALDRAGTLLAVETEPSAAAA
jgi:ArsR family transcriptional regulator, arsenate/arsenite/antimonite-responsive transcriptional repressor